MGTLERGGISGGVVRRTHTLGRACRSVVFFSGPPFGTSKSAGFQGIPKYGGY